VRKEGEEKGGKGDDDELGYYRKMGGGFNTLGGEG